ncbi:MAG: NADP-dependent malic enzyme [Anaerolineae bacterium]|nr:NADP-dependent malic enzyme [Anaerolineae bacterium]
MSRTHGSAIGIESLEYHRRPPRGKLEITPTKPCATQRDLTLAYSPGVAEPCLAIHDHPEDIYEYTAKGNLVAVISNGTAVLGLGNIGAAAGKPVMEGKALLFKRFADVDSIDIELATEDPDAFIAAVKLMEPSFGGINLEDIKAPECFYIEEQLRAAMHIPVMHDDQHGTAIISGAALLNACELVGKRLSEVRIVINGAGASAIACANFYVALGARRENIILCDSKGVIYKGRVAGMNAYKEAFAVDTPLRTLEQAIAGADVFVGLSVAGVVTPEMVKTMAARPIIFAMANPDPEIGYDEAKAARPDAIVATGRSDYPNQVNNVLGFPFIFRGALDVRATQINEAMKIAAAHALAALARQDVPDEVVKAYGLERLSFGPEYLIPKPLDPRVLLWEAPAVAQAAMDSDVARVRIDMATYRQQLEARLGKSREMMRIIYNKAAGEPKRIVLAEGEHEKIIRAARQLVDEGIAHPILLGDAAVINQKARELKLDLTGIRTLDPKTSPDRDRYINYIYALRQRKGVTMVEARELVANPNYFAAVMVALGEADGMISGLSLHYPDVMRPALRIIGTSNGNRIAAGVYMVTLKDRVLFFADTTVNIDVDAEKLAEIALLTADLVRQFDVEPRIAMLSFSSFGSTRHPRSEMVRQAVEIARRRAPHLHIEGELMADTALSEELLRDYPFNVLGQPANVLIFPNLEAGNIAYKLMRELASAEVVGPILIGMRKPVHVLQRGDSVRSIVNLAALAVVEAQRLDSANKPEPGASFGEAAWSVIRT